MGDLKSQQRYQNKTPSRSTNRYIEPEKLQIISNEIAENIEQFFEYFGYDGFVIKNNKITGPCPIHEGDNSIAFNLWTDGYSSKGNWKCRTHGCEKKWNGTAIGLIRGLIAKNTGKDASLFDAVDLASKILDKNLDDIKIDRSKIEKKQYSKIINYFTDNSTEKQKISINRSTVLKNLSIPSKYFINRGFDRHVLQKYDVGDCLAKGREMYLRAVAPIYELDAQTMIGCTGRSFFEKCEKCGMHHHSSSATCPSKEYYAIYCKWRHQTGFRAENWLYNLWYSLEYIQKTSWITIVESPGNVWKLEELGIKNSVAMFGSSLTANQKLLLDKTGALNILFLPDAGKAGEDSVNSMIKECGRRYNIEVIDPWWEDDVANISSQENKQRLVGEIERIIK